MVKGSKALLWGLALMMGGTGAAEAASQLLCSMRWSSANEAVDQRLGGDCMLVTAKGALQVPQLFQQVGGGLQAGRFAFKRDELWGYADDAGRVLVAPSLSIARPFVEGRAMVCREEAERRFCGYLGLDGKPAFPLIEGLYFLRDYRGGQTLAAPDGGRGNFMMDSAGVRQELGASAAGRCNAWVLETRSARALGRLPADGRLPVPGADAQHPLGDCAQALEAVPPLELDLPALFSEWLHLQVTRVHPLNEGVRAMATDGPWGWGLLDEQAKLLVGPAPRLYSEPLDLSLREGLLPVRLPTGENLGQVQSPSTVRFMAVDGSYPLPGDFEDAHGFHEGLAAARSSQNHLWGFIDHQGAWVIAPSYPAVIDDFDEGRAVVTLPLPYERSVEALIDRGGQVLARYDELLARHFPDPQLEQLPGPLPFLPCVLNGANYLSPEERRVALEGQGGDWAGLCVDDQLRAKAQQMAVRLHGSLAPERSILQWSAALDAWLARLRACKADTGCQRALLDEGLSDPRWAQPVASEGGMALPELPGGVPEALQQRLRQQVAQSGNYSPEDEDMGDGWGKASLGFGRVDLGEGRPGVLVSQNVQRSNAHWLFAVDDPGEAQLLLEGQGMLGAVSGPLSQGHVPVRVYADQGQGVSDWRFNGSTYVLEASCWQAWGVDVLLSYDCQPAGPDSGR
ncbi:WG repeat-containing protein [Pseudomonas solani]|uniref:WG repeat-containing protein n=1 Tax=Pseudomonas solani TaxID=2731552 RepID=UPI003C2E9894